HVDEQTSIAVGRRRGRPVLLQVRAREMHQAGCEFFVTPNQVWLTDSVPAEYIEFP
ncbi:MAG TPA: RNA--NAD 2'-phosphotransferase, partial [Gimesia maris]|nr:RNA--NAD 2'-phosphotransferase [Gimesia maris]